MSNAAENKLLNLKRRHILGNLYGRCETIESVPVFLEVETEEPIGFADESLGRYVDAFSFHLPETTCKRLSSNGYLVSVDYAISELDAKMFRINHFVLVVPPSAIGAPKSKKPATVAAKAESAEEV